MLSPFHQQCLLDLGFYECRHVATFQACEVARRWRTRLTERLMCEAMKPDGDLIQIFGITRRRAEYLEALREIISWTYRICRDAAREEGPAMVHVPARACEEGSTYGGLHRGSCRRHW